MEEPRTVVLRHSRDAGGSRHLEARLNEAGDLVIEGQDLGPAVEEFFGSREYEWIWTVKAADLAGLRRSLPEQGELLELLARLFSGDDAGRLKDFLEKNAIPHQTWSRLGD